MRSSTRARAERSDAAGRLPSDDSNSVGAMRQRWTPARLLDGVARLIRGCVRRLAERRRRRAGLHAWMTMDPRLLADIGVRRSDVHAVVYAGVPIERLRARPARGSDGEVAGQPCRTAPHLRLVGADHLDEAA
jgi:uncharacterized protein YjiS (DUF1127 family)